MIRHRLMTARSAKHAGDRALLRAAAVGERGHLVHGQLRSLQIMMSADVNNAPRTCADDYLSAVFIIIPAIPEIIYLPGPYYLRIIV